MNYQKINKQIAALKVNYNLYTSIFQTLDLDLEFFKKKSHVEEKCNCLLFFKKVILITILIEKNWS